MRWNVSQPAYLRQRNTELNLERQVYQIRLHRRSLASLDRETQIVCAAIRPRPLSFHLNPFLFPTLPPPRLHPPPSHQPKKTTPTIKFNRLAHLLSFLGSTNLSPHLVLLPFPINNPLVRHSVGQNLPRYLGTYLRTYSTVEPNESHDSVSRHGTRAEQHREEGRVFRRQSLWILLPIGRDLRLMSGQCPPYHALLWVLRSQRIQTLP